MLEESYIDAFLVAHGGRLVTEDYFNHMTQDTHHLLNSVTKSFVGMLAGIAVGEGLLDPEQLIAHYLPELDGSAWEGATVRHLLDMTTGVKYEEEYSDPETDFWKEAAVVGWSPALVDENTPASLFDYARSLRGQDQENGSKFYYRSVNTNVLGMILEKVMDVPLGDSLTDALWSNLHTWHDASIVVDPVGFPYVGAGMSACARDLVNFGLMMINDGMLCGQQIVPAAWVRDTIAGDASSKQCFKDGAYGEAMAGWHYRNQVWVKDSEGGVMLAIGIHGQGIYMDKRNNVVIVVLSSQPASLDLEMNFDIVAGMDSIATHLGAD
jgi:CubicO group peptidase (beta-lactamase class C family)